MENDSLPVQPPETDYVSEQYILFIPADSEILGNRWELRKHATRMLKHQIGDYAQVTDVKAKRPHIISRAKSKLLRRPAQAKLFITVKF